MIFSFGLDHFAIRISANLVPPSFRDNVLEREYDLTWFDHPKNLPHFTSSPKPKLKLQLRLPEPVPRSSRLCFYCSGFRLGCWNSRIDIRFPLKPKDKTPIPTLE